MTRQRGPSPSLLLRADVSLVGAHTASAAAAEVKQNTSDTQGLSLNTTCSVKHAATGDNKT